MSDGPDYRALFLAALKKAGGRLIIDDFDLPLAGDECVGLGAGSGATEWRIFHNVPERKPSANSRDKGRGSR